MKLREGTFTLPSTNPQKTNMEPQNRGLEDDFPFQKGDFQVNHVDFRGSKTPPSQNKGHPCRVWVPPTGRLDKAEVVRLKS